MLKIIVVNLMPNKIVTEQQIRRVLGANVELTFLRMASYQSKHTDFHYLKTHYKTLSELDLSFDGMIITGSPVETWNYHDITYLDELYQIFEYSKQLSGTLHICFAAQAALHYHYGVQKKIVDSKIFGVFRHQSIWAVDSFIMPHSSYVVLDETTFPNDLVVLSYAKETGPSLMRCGNFFFITGHLEYDLDTLQLEYERDLLKGIADYNYYESDLDWRDDAQIIFKHWLCELEAKR